VRRQPAGRRDGLRQVSRPAEQKEGGYLAGAEEKGETGCGDVGRARAPNARHVARPARAIAARQAFSCPTQVFIIVKEDQIGTRHPFSGEKLSPVLAIFKYEGFNRLLEMVSAIFEVGGKGHSLGIASFDDDHIHRLASMAPVSRMMVRQPNVSGNAGRSTNVCR